MNPIRVRKIAIQGIKGVLKPIELSLGKSSNPCSLAIFAPNACGKSGIADALEYFFDEKGEVEHLGIKSDSETGGKAAIPHIHAKKSNIKPEINLTFHGGQFSNTARIIREVKTGTKDSVPPEIVNIIDSARAVRILRQHDLRRFVVDYEPSRKYEEMSRWVGLKILDTLREQVIKAQNDFSKKNYQEAIKERLVDISVKTGNKVTNYSEKNILSWINESLLVGIGIGKKLESLSDTNNLYEELDRIQAEEDKKLGVKVFQEFLEIVPLVKDEHGKIVSFEQFSFVEKMKFLKSALDKLDEATTKAKAAIFKELWEIGLPLLENNELYMCPLCESKWENTQHKSQTTLIEVLRRNLDTLKSVSLAENEVSKTRKETIETLQNDKTLLLTISERSKSARLEFNQQIENSFKDILNNLLSNVDAEKCKAAQDIPDDSSWIHILETMKAEILNCAKKAEIEIQAEDKESPERKRFQNAKNTITEIIKSKGRYDELELLQNEYEKVGDALAKIATTIREEIKNQMQNVLELLKNDISYFYKKINRGRISPKIYIELPPDRTASLYLRISFYDLKDPVPPGGYLSESYINTLGIAVFLASVKNFNSSFPFIVLDDIVSSYDAEHRSYIVDVLAEDFEDYQIILTTHDHIFYRHLKQRLQDKNWRFKQIKGWKIEEGPLLDDEVTDEREIENLFKDRTNYHRAGNAIRVFMEEWFDHICPELGVHTPHKRGMHDYNRTLFDFWIPFLNQVISFGSDVKSWLEKQECYNRLKSHPLINYYSHNQSNPYEWGSMGDVEYVWENFKTFRALFKCSQCIGKLTYSFGDKRPYCKKCGQWPKITQK